MQENWLAGTSADQLSTRKYAHRWALSNRKDTEDSRFSAIFHGRGGAQNHSMDARTGADQACHNREIEVRSDKPSTLDRASVESLIIEHARLPASASSLAPPMGKVL